MTTTRNRDVWIVALLAVSLCARARAAEEDPRKKAQRVTSYVLLAETITRVSLQVADVLKRNPYDKAVSTYAREIGRLHAKLYAKLTPPDGAESLHKQFKNAVLNFAKMTDAHRSGEYETAAQHRDKCLKEFTESLAALVKLKQRGVLP